MNLDLSIANLEKAVNEIKRASLSDDKTPLGNALALKKESDLIDLGQSEFKIIIFGDLNDFKSLNDIHTHEAGDTALFETGKTIQIYLSLN
jgi:GGDEF domain-containing protein